jgi:hypothetical protein
VTDKMPWEWDEETKLIARQRIAKVMGMPLERLKNIICMDASALEAGRTQVEFVFDPVLSDAESVQFIQAMRLISAVFGGRPPVFIGQA